MGSLRVIRGLIRVPKGKFKPNWSGPYFIRELTLKGAAWLMDLDGNRFSESTNVDKLKRYYLWVIVTSIVTFIANVTSLHVGFERIITPFCTLCFTIILIFAFDSSSSFHPLFVPYNDPFRPRFPSFLLPYHPSLHYVPCLKTTLRPWDQMSSSTTPTWIDVVILLLWDTSLLMHGSDLIVDLDYGDQILDDG
ncbi:hypothetical protein AAG906_016381 [Vitis piasezkii]